MFADNSSELHRLQRQVSSALVSPPPIDDLLADDIMAPYRHVASLESKKFRAALVDAFNVWLLLPPAATDEVKAVVDMLHNASLVIDDIEDSSAMRRGAPAAHRVFGMPLSLNCANTVYFLALQRLMDVPRLLAESVLHEASHPYYLEKERELALSLSQCFTKEMIELHHGQGLDIYWRDMVQCPSLSEYDQMVKKKTGGLFRLAVRLMTTLSPPTSQQCSEGGGLPWQRLERSSLHDALIDVADVLGVFFQTLDDFLNVSSQQYHKNKSFCEDLTEGKFSYPVIHCLQRQATCGEKTLLHMLRQRPEDVEVKKYCVELMRKSGSLKATRDRIDELRAVLLSKMDALGGGNALRLAVDGLCAMIPAVDNDGE